MKLSLFLACVFAAALIVPLVTGCNDDNSNGKTAYIIFMSDTGTNNEVWGMNLDGTNKTFLASYDTADAIQGSLSPDGTKLIFVKQDTGSQIVVKDLTTSVDTVLLEDAASSGNDFAPVFNPAGTKIAYHDDRDDAIHVMNADGTGDVSLPNGSSTDHAPSWNADGTKLIVDRGWNGSIYTMNADGTDQVVVIAEDESNTYGHPRFLPNGKIICTRFGNLSKDIVMVNADGSDLVNLTPDTDTSDEFFPTASSSGLKIAFSTDRNDGFDDVYVADFDGSVLTNLVNLTGDMADDNWRPVLTGKKSSID